MMHQPYLVAVTVTGRYRRGCFPCICRGAMIKLIGALRWPAGSETLVSLATRQPSTMQAPEMEAVHCQQRIAILELLRCTSAFRNGSIRALLGRGRRGRSSLESGRGRAANPTPGGRVSHANALASVLGLVLALFATVPCAGNALRLIAPLESDCEAAERVRRH
jgi:hypothetical protein